MSHFSNKEAEITEMALGQLAEATGWKGHWKSQGRKGMDGKVKLEHGRKRIEFDCEVKNVVQHVHLPKLLNFREEGKNMLVISGSMSRKLMDELRDLKINYLDSGGNAHIETDDVFIHIEGRKSGLDTTRRHLFTKSSVQLLFYLLIEPDLLKLPYREISTVTGASLDNISKTIKTLKDNGFLVTLRNSEYAFSEKKALLERWIPEYGERLKPKLLLGRFRFLKEERWENLPLDYDLTRWGGEPAVDKLLRIIRPEVFTLYTQESKQDLIKKYRLIPDPAGGVKVYRAFWDLKRYPESETVPLLLIYADLLLSGSARNVEVAKNLMDAKKEAVV